MDITYQRIKDRRRELKMSQLELARRVGYGDRSTIAKIESGLVNISQTKVMQFAEALDVPIEWLLGLDVYDMKREAADLLSKLSDQELQTVLTLLRQMTAGRT